MTAAGDGPEDFVLGPLLGEGSTARVHRATHAITATEVALKIWHTPTAALDHDARRRFAQECRLLQDLSGRTDRVVRYHWSGLAGGFPWLAMQCCNTSLAEVAAQESLDIDTVLDLADDVLAALQEIHAAGHLHRDLKPANVLLHAGRAVVGDFGIALPAGRLATDLGAGTHGFLAPELLAGANPSARSDLYSLGRTLLTVLPDDLPPRLDALLTRVTSHAPDDRPADAATLRTSLASLRTALGATAAPARRLTVATSGVQRTVEPDDALVIGRGPAADLDVPDPAVSRQHAVVRCHNGLWTIADLASANGLWHAGRRVTRLEVGEQPVTARLGGPDGVAVVLRPG